MTVTELIAALQGYPPDAVVCVETYDREYGVVDVDPVREIKAGSEYYDSIACEWITTVAVVIA